MAFAHPGGIGPLGGKDIAVGGKLGAPLGRIYGPAARAGGRAGRFIAVVYALLLALASPPRPLRRPACPCPSGCRSPCLRGRGRVRRRRAGCRRRPSAPP